MRPFHLSDLSFRFVLRFRHVWDFTAAFATSRGAVFDMFARAQQKSKSLPPPHHDTFLLAFGDNHHHALDQHRTRPNHANLHITTTSESGESQKFVSSAYCNLFNTVILVITFITAGVQLGYFSISRHSLDEEKKSIISTVFRGSGCCWVHTKKRCGAETLLSLAPGWLYWCRKDLLSTAFSIIRCWS